nr:MAG TPA: SNARE Vesicle transport v-SNARE protein N-terminus [Caudoviricetes sp.]
MNAIKQAMIESLEHSIEAAEERIEELKKPSQKSAVHMRTAERDFWRKKIKRYKEQLEELKNE